MQHDSELSLFKVHPLVLAMAAIFLPSLASAQSNTGAAQLPTITVKAKENNDANTEGTGSYTAKSTNTATKLNMSLRETPQAVKIYTREYLDDRNIESFQELMSNVTGVTVSRTDERQSYFARGFQLDYHLIDGMPSTSSLAEGDLDLGIYDRVEVVKGANGLNSGAGNPSMGVNMGRTLNHSFVILDEAQNTTPEQMKMFLTRLGFGSRAVITGDVTQVDLPRGQQSGLAQALRVLENVHEIHITRFHSRDVVRHQLVQKIVEAYEGWDSEQQRLSAEARAERKAKQEALIAENDEKADAQH